MADQLATVSKQRLGAKLATLREDDMKKVEAAVLLQLGNNAS